jgi:tetratricopeptide (TPR) repeat protein
MMNFISPRDIYDLYRHLTEKELFDLYQSAFNETKMKFPLVDKKEARLSQIDEEIRGILSDLARYRDTGDLKSEIFSIYCREMREEIPEEMLSQFLGDLFGVLEMKIRSHPKIRDELDSMRIDETNRLIRQLSQCKSFGEIRTPEGTCKTDFLTEGFVGKVRLVLGTHVDLLGKVNCNKALRLVEKMEGDPEYPAKNTKLASEVCNIFIESFDHLPGEAKDTRIAFSVILSKLTGIPEPLLSCELPSTYNEINFQAYATLSTLALNEGDIGAARTYFRDLTEYAESRERVPMLLLEGRILIAEYSLDEAIRKLENILNDADFCEKKTILHYLGIVCYKRSDLEKCFKYWNDLKEIEDDRGRRSVTVANIGIVYRSKGNPDEALRCYQEALQIHRDIGYREGEASDLGNIGNIHQLKGNLDEALAYYQEALQIDRDIGHREGEANQLGNIGNIYRSRGNPDEALKYYQEALQIDRDIGHREGEANQLGNIGNIYRSRGNLDEALKYYQEALQIDRDIGHREGEAGDLGDIGNIYHTRGNPDEALKYYQEALQIDRDIGYREGEASDLGNIGLIYRSRGNLDEALKYQKEALQIHRDIGYREGEASDLGNIGLIYRSRGNLDEALKYLQEALQIHRDIGYIEGEANSLGNIGGAYELKGNLDEALKYYQEALQIDKDIGYREGEANGLGNIGNICQLEGNYDEALKYYQEALQIDRDIGYREGEASDLGNIGVVLKLLRKNTEALHHLSEALDIFENIGMKKEANIASQHILELCMKD